MTVKIVKNGAVIEKKQVIGTVSSSVKDGNTNIVTEEQETTEVVDEVIVDELMANVGVKLGTTENLGDFQSRRVDVSIYMPSKTDKKSLDKTFKKCFKWCVGKLDWIDALDKKG